MFINDKIIAKLIRSSEKTCLISFIFGDLIDLYKGLYFVSRVEKAVVAFQSDEKLGHLVPRRSKELTPMFIDRV